MRSGPDAVPRRDAHRVAAGVLLYDVLVVLWLIAKPGSHHLFTVVDNFAQFVGTVLLVLAFFWYVRRNHPVLGRTRAASVLLAMGVLSWAVGQGIWTFYEVVLRQQTPFPSPADVGYLSSVPLLLVGILVIPGRRLSLVFRTRVALDGLMVMTAAVTFSWYFVLGPTILQGGESTVAKVVGTSYPLGDLLLIACLLLLIGQVHDAAMRPVVTLLAAGLVSIIAADTLFDYGTLHNTYATGQFLDIGWPLGDSLVGLAALFLVSAGQMRGAVGGDESSARQRAIWISLLPYSLVPAVGLLFVYMVHVQHDVKLEFGVILGGVMLIGLVLLRQVLAILDNGRLTAALHARNEALVEANHRLESLATSDPLTGLANHRALVAAIDAELERSRRYRRPCSIIFVDLDHFKSLNDGFGHAAGDAALAELGKVVQEQLRSIDILGRWGGEEFLVVLPETDRIEALAVAERVRARVASHRFAVGMGAHLTCSLGIATVPDDAVERDDLVALADRAMYAAKRLGRNQVRVAGDTALEALEGVSGAAGSRDEASLLGTVEALAALVDARDQYTGQHAHDVSRLSMHIGIAMGLPPAEVHLIGLAGRLHDVGKVAVPDAVLQKRGRLTEEEWRLVRLHPVVGAHVVSRVPGLAVLAPIIRGHHERWDGTGYPDRQRGEEIHLGARVLATADAFHAMTADRPYRSRCTPEEALLELQRGAGSQWDPAIVDALQRVVAPQLESSDNLRAG